MEATSSLEALIKKARSEPFDTFINYPFREIRDVCVKEIERQYSDIGIGFANQAEAIIKRLQLVDWRHDYWKKILGWYLFAAEDEPVLKRAIKFALGIYYEDTVLHDNLISKLLAGRLKGGFLCSKLYDKMPSLKNFFHRFLRDIYMDTRKERLRLDGYSESDWYLAKRAVDIAVYANDFSLLWEIEQAVMLIEEGVISPERDSHWSARESDLTYLKTAEKLLNKAKCKAMAGEA